ncbi:patatin-like phospholipase family protein [Rhizobium halophytocola]|uniref:PNPLA domain-containing protein n=1 Tax=Rhizobium halophytocola TaxID=735519 RepID=A0ABS4E0T8_9HYPH|nr:patatin-like phospholipase family protein [Rhizobium halophytocola]MBP1851559.1 hypothetical protein [Rhizobium halophytocola]
MLLRQEAQEIEGVSIPAGLDTVELNRALNGLDRTALCISGGGIRSATFALGVMQALATYPRDAAGEPARPEASLLGRFRYLSTVSGGGYIGSWLSAWLSRQSFDRVQAQLTQRPDGPDREPLPICNLRRDSNYLTPKVGLTSADTWTAATIVVRNLTLVWLLVVSALASLLLALKWVLVTLTFVGATGPFAEHYYTHAGLLAAGTLLLMLGQRYTLVNYAQGDAGGNQSEFIRWDLLFAIFGAALLTTWAILPIGVQKWAPDTLNVMLVGPTIFIASGLLSYPAHRGQPHSPLLRLIRWAFAGVVWSAVILAGIHLFVGIDYAPARLLTLAVLGPPWFLMAQVTAETVYVAETSTETRSDAQREWFARAAGWFVAAGVFWTVSTILGLLGSRLADLLRSETNLLYHSLIGGSLAATATMGLLGGRKDNPQVVSGLTRLGKFIQLAGGQAFLALVLIILSALLDYIVLGTSLLEVLLAPVKSVGTTIADKDTGLDTLLFGRKIDVIGDAGNLVPLLFQVFILTALIAWVVSRTVNINRFSLHDLYRNRLVRAYLGATHADRQPNPFTGFDLHDNPLMHELWPQQGVDRNRQPIGRLFHVVNCTLNVVSTRNNAWQQRKAMSFVVTPRHAGAADLCPRTPQGFRGAYQPSAQYGGKQGISLGTAMAVSGAAANPNMGYNSAPSITLLFALFNVRLGWWLANPGPNGRRFWQLSGPRQALVPWLQEAFGQTTADRAYVNLSDGGHFENLALYEMVRRRCRLIVLSDAGCDPDFTFADLGNAVRKIHIDLGVCLTFPELDQLKPRILSGEPPDFGPYCTVGRIHYRDADGGGEDGYVLYIKPGYHGTEGAGICAYANESPTFPHESTADQWFSESQFESYRSLGFEIVDTLLAGVGPLPPDATLLQIVQAVERQIAGSPERAAADEEGDKPVKAAKTSRTRLQKGE